MHRSERLAGRHPRVGTQSGFSLIELVAVVAILGVLAAIAIPTFLGMQSSAKDAAVQADLVNAKTALTAFASGHGGDLPASVTRSGSATWAATTVDLAGYGWSRSAATTDIAYTVTAGPSWCLLATSATGSVFRVTPTSGVVPSAACPPAS